MIIRKLLFIFAFLILLCSGWVYEKKTNEKEQLILSEVRSFLHFQNDELLTIVKPTLFSSFDQWFVEVKGSHQKFRYVNGAVQVLD